MPFHLQHISANIKVTHEETDLSGSAGVQKSD